MDRPADYFEDEDDDDDDVSQRYDARAALAARLAVS